jgi:hypothetical protein
MPQETYNDVTVVWTPSGGTAITLPDTSCTFGDDAAAVPTSAGGDAAHSAADGIALLSVNVGFAGSAPGMGLGQYGTLAIAGMSGSVTPAAIFEKNVEGQEDGQIQGTLLILPALDFPVSGGGGYGSDGENTGDFDFNGSSLTFDAVAVAGLRSLRYEGRCARIACTGINGSGGAPTVVRLFRPGLPLEIVTAQIVGLATPVKGTVAALLAAWADGGEAGSMDNARLMTQPRMAGRLDAENVSTLTWRNARVVSS